MRLSALQKFILLECLNSKTGRISRTRLVKFYNTPPALAEAACPAECAGSRRGKKRPTDLMITKIITKSIERLIDKELMVGFGERTPHKWYIKEIRLLPKGKKVAKKLLGEQLSFKFRKTRKYHRIKISK